MKVILSFVCGLVLAGSAAAYTTNLISNGSFESGTNGWMFYATATNAQFQTVSTAFAGVKGLRVFSRLNFAEAL